MNKNENSRLDFLEVWLIIVSISSGFGSLLAVSLISEGFSFSILIVIGVLIGGNILTWSLMIKDRRKYAFALSLGLFLLSGFPLLALFILAFTYSLM